MGSFRDRVVHQADLRLNAVETKFVNKNIIVYDLETTGLNPSEDEIIEIGAVKLKFDIDEGFSIIDRFSSFIKPKNPIPANITDITGITNQDVANAAGIVDVLNEFIEWAYGGGLKVILVAQNAKFDNAFLYRSLFNCGKLISAVDHIDTMKMSKAIGLTAKHNLKVLCDTFNVDYDKDSHHRADYDAEITSKVFINMIGDHLIDMNFNEATSTRCATINQKNYILALSEAISSQLKDDEPLKTFLTCLTAYIDQVVNEYNVQQTIEFLKNKQSEFNKF